MSSRIALCHINCITSVTLAILFSLLGIHMASCSYILMLFFTKISIVSNGVLSSLNGTKCGHEHV